MDRRRRRFLTVAGIAGLAGLAGCSGLLTEDEDGTSDATSQQHTLVPDDGDRRDEFGTSVALAEGGSTALVSAEEDEIPNGEGAGSAYVFTRNGNGWSQGDKLAADDGDIGDGFGESVALDDDGLTALVGAETDEDPNGDESGSAYVFTRSGDSWSQQAKLAADDGDSEDWFGQSVALSADGSTALIVALDRDPNESGSAYVFTRSGDSWSQVAKLAPDDGDSGDEFGSSMALSGDGSVALIGASEDAEPNGPGAGSAYVFARSESGWSQVARLAPDDGASGDEFGSSVAVSDDGSTALVSAGVDEENGAGSAYVFARTGGGWSQQAKLAADDGDSGDGFGESVALAGDGSTALVGAATDDDPNGPGAGSAYVFARSESGWSQVAKLAPDDGDSGDEFGNSVTLATDGSTALAGAPAADTSNGDVAGAAYVFERPWEE